MAEKAKSSNVANASGKTSSSMKEVEKKDLIVQNRIWTAALEKEKQCRKSWFEIFFYFDIYLRII